MENSNEKIKLRNLVSKNFDLGQWHRIYSKND